jgi:hypothetical protein
MQDPYPNLRIFAQWRLAHEAATALEIALLDASLRAMSGSCVAPSRAAWERAKNARAAAKALFLQAMAEVDRVNVHAARTGADATCGGRTLAPERRRSSSQETA